MIDNKKGHIFNMCSIASIMPYGAYAVSKHAMLGYSRVLREELKKKGFVLRPLCPVQFIRLHGMDQRFRRSE